MKKKYGNELQNEIYLKFEIEIFNGIRRKNVIMSKDAMTIRHDALKLKTATPEMTAKPANKILQKWQGSEALMPIT